MEWREARRASINVTTCESLNMDKLRGSGNTFSTSGQAWKPFRFNPKLANKMGRLHRLQRKGMTPATDKASLRQAATDAAATHPIRQIKAGHATGIKPS